MKRKKSNSASPDQNRAADAADWVMRLDRGLSPDEQDHYLQWLTADARHAAAIAKHRNAWEAFDRLAGLQSTIEAMPDPDLLRPRRRGFWDRTSDFVVRWRLVRRAAWPVGLAAAAVVAFILRPGERASSILPASEPAAAPHPPLSRIEERLLDDGSIIHLNRETSVAVEFSAAERRVRLEHGEASFSVTKDAARPFIVMTAGVAVRAVGTAFNVRLGDQAVDVIVTEGSVVVAGGNVPAGITAPTVEAGQKVVVPLGPNKGVPNVSTLPAEELSRRLAWQPRMLTFNNEALGVILSEFNRHNSLALRVADPGLEELRLSARFRSDNVQGFLRLLESDFHVRLEYPADGGVVLRSAP